MTNSERRNWSVTNFTVVNFIFHSAVQNEIGTALTLKLLVVAFEHFTKCYLLKLYIHSVFLLLRQYAWTVSTTHY
jgi:hypothetical protein